MAYQTGRPVKVPAKGDAPNTGAPGKTPAPTSADLARMKDVAYGRTSYGGNAYAGRVVADPGKSVTSPLADQLKAKAAESDGGDLLRTIIERGTARGPAADVELQSPQTRDVSKEPYPSAHGMQQRGIDSGSPGAVVPATTGQPSGDYDARRAAQLRNAK